MLSLYRIFTLIVYYVIYPYSGLAALFGSRKWRNRLGFHWIEEGETKGKLIWLHASSMGEVSVLVILAAQLRALCPDCRIYTTVMTATGLERAERELKGNSGCGYLPLDFRFPIERFLNRIKPSAAVFIETEIWPNLICLLGEKKIPVILANGRLSEKAHRRYRRVKTGMKKVLSNYSEMVIQSEEDASRLSDIGAEREKISILGSLKFDAPASYFSPAEKNSLRSQLPFPPDARIFIAGSTRNGENEIIIELFLRLRKEFDNLRLLLVPRHLEKIPQIIMAADGRGLKYVLHSQISAGMSQAEAVIVDKMGILNDLYQISEIAFVGGTLNDIGGHNILEPVWAGIPVLYGPSIFNVGDSSRYILENGFGEMIKDGEELYMRLRQFFGGEISYQRRSELSRESTRAYRTARKILKYMS